MNTARLLAATAAIAVAMGAVANAHATTGVWTNTAASGNWADAKNWENAYVPTNAGDSASFPDSSFPVVNYAQMLRTVTLPSHAVEIDYISGVANHTLTGPAVEQTYSFLDAADFAGAFKPECRHTLSFRATAAHTPVVQRIYANGRPIVNVPDADGVLVVSNAYGNAVFDKSGPGTLRLVNGGGAQTRLRIRESSTVELCGAPADLDASSLDGLPAPLSWFDASTAASITTNSEGKVTKWADVRDAAAGTSSFRHLKEDTSIAPPVPATDAASGLGVVDFGLRGGEGASALFFNNEFGNNVASELFIAYRNNSETVDGIFFGAGNAKNYNVNSSSGYDIPVFNAADTGARLRTGEIRLDGNLIWWDEQCRPRGGFRTLMIGGGAAAHRFNCIGYQRGIGAGGIQAGEILVFGSPLSPDQKRRVIAYLKAKWCKGDNARSWELGGVELVNNATLSVPAGRRARVARISTSTGKTLSIAGGGVLETSLIGTPPKGARTPIGTETGVKWNTANPMPVSVSAGATLRIVRGVEADADAALPADPYAHFDATEASTITVENGAVTEWRDVRSGSTVKAVGVNSPEVLENAMNGNSVVSTKDLNRNNSQPSFSLYSGGSAVSRGVKNCREAFVAGRASRAGDGWGYAMFLASIDRWFSPSDYGLLFTGGYNGSKVNEGYSTANIDNYIALDGVPVDPNNYVMTTNWLVISTSFRTLQTWTHLARYGTSFTGGIDYGEIIVYDRSLTPGERRNVEAYLLKKWRGIDVHPENAPSRTGATSLALGATLDLAEGAGLAVQGDLSVADGATISLGLAPGASTTPLTVAGTASFAGAATIRVAFDGSYGEHPLVAASAISGDLADLSLDIPGGTKGRAKLKQSGGSLILKYSPTATVISLR